MAFDINTAVLEDNSSSSFDINTATLNDELVETNKVEEKADITPEQLRSIPAQISAAPKTQSYLEPLASDTQIFKKPENIYESFQQAFHWLTQVPVSAFKTGYNNIDVADLEMKGIYSGKELNPAQLSELDKLQSQTFGRYNRENNYQIIEPEYNQKDPFTIEGATERIKKGAISRFLKKSYAETVSQLPIMIETIKTGGIGSVIGGGAGAVIGAGAAIVGGQLGPQVATPEEIVTVPTAAIQGAKRGFLFGGRVGAAKRVFELEAGLTKNELRTINKEIENEGGEPLSEQELNLFAIGVGGVNAGLEIASLEKLLETIPNGKQIIDKLKDKQLKALIQNPTVRNQMLDVLKKYGTAALTEASTEAAQEATNIIAGETVRKLGELEPTPMVDNVKRVIDAGSTGFGVALFLGGVGSTAQTVTILTKKGVSKQEATEIANGMTPEERHQFVDENSDVLLRSVEDLPEVKELQAKEMYKESLFKQAKQAGLDDVEANANAELFAESFANLAKQTGMSIEDIQNEANIVIQNLSDQEAIQQYNEDSRKVLQGRVEEVKYQSAASAGANENEVAIAEKEYAEKGTESKYFKRYFDGSKAVDEDGEPLILYHNTNNDFEIFSREFEGKANGRPVYGGGFNFTQYKDYAGQFGKKQMAVYLSIKNPLNEETYDAEKFIEPVAELMYGKDYKKYLLKYDDYYATGYLEGKLDTLYGLRDLMQGLQYDKGVDVIEFYKSLGYDGIQDGHIWIAFSPEQIKSVDNRGTFDANNPNIYYQGGSLEFEVDESFDLNKYIKSLNVKKNIKKSSENFAEKLELILDDKLASGVEPIVLFKPTKILTRVGIPDAKIVFKQGKIKKVLNEHLTIEDLKKIPELLANPEYIFESATDENGFVVVLTREERPLIVAITKVGKEFKIKNIIKSAYNKGVNFVSDNIKEGRLLYDKSNPTRFRQHRASIAQAKTLSDNNIITDFERGFKSVESVNDDRNLIIAHASKASTINDIIEVGSLIAPSFSITSKESEVLEEGKFGEVIFVRNPKKIDYKNDNIFDRDIYSPRMPRPYFDIPNGRVVDYYEYDSLKRSYEYNPEKFVEKWGKTFEEYFAGAKKVLYLGMTNSGNRRYVPYTAENILKEMKKQGLLNKEGFDYGLSSLLARFSSKQTTKEMLKETAKQGLAKTKDIDKQWEEIKEEYDKLGEKLAEYYYDKWSFYEVQSEAFYAIAKNMKKTINELFTKEIPENLKQEVKDFVEKAKSLPRSYFEAKPMKEVGLSEIDNVLVEENVLTEEQKKGLESWGVKVTEYKKGELYKTLENLDKKSGNVYFQSAFHGTPHRFDEFALDHIGTGEGHQAHGWGLYFAGNKDVSEVYREILNSRDLKYDGKSVGLKQQYNMKNIDKYGKKGWIEELNEQLTEAKNELGLMENAVIKNNGNKIIVDAIKAQKEIIARVEEDIKISEKIDAKKISKGQLYEVDIPENDVLLDEDLLLSEQPEKVKNGILQIFKEKNPADIVSEKINLFDNMLDELEQKAIQDGGYTTQTNYSRDIYENKKAELENLLNKLNNYSKLKGKDVYKILSVIFEGDKEASLLLNEYGIKGITYDGKQDGRCFVIFDDKAINVIKTYYQSIEDDSNLNDTERGIINSRGFTYQRENFDGSPKENMIVLLKHKANASTLVHEFAHVYLQTLNNLARNNVKAKELLLTVNKWLRYDGREYTTAQHEKFANGFVAFVKSGKAPSYGLKRVFENFRRWLGDIWNSVSQSDEVEIDEETRKVFNTLLGDISVGVQDEQIEKLLDDAKQNAALRLLNENIENGDVKFNELTETQRRYRDTAYDIIYYALKHSKNEETRNYVQGIADLRMKLAGGKTKSLQRQAERIHLLLAETDDAFSANDGFLPEWGEFFTDPGVSYDNQEVGADAELALDALDVIVNKKYLFSDNNFGELSQEEVKRYEYEYEYILNEYKKSNDKSIPMMAFYTWHMYVHDYLQEEFYKKWENETNEIDRYNNLSKFEQAKEDLKLKAAKMQGLGDYSQQFAEYAREIIKRLDFMTERDKARIFDKLKDFNSFREVQANLDDVMDFAETLYNVTERRKIADDIIREVKQTIHEWKDGIKRTKYTYPANKLFERLRELNKLPQEDIQDIYDAQVNEEIKPTYEADKVNTDDYYETIEKMFIEFKANGVYYNSSEFLQNLLTRIQDAKFTAKIARDEMDFERRMQSINLIDECARAVGKHKNKTSKLEKAYRFGFNLNSALEMMFDNNIKNKFSLDYLYAQKDAKVGADRDDVLKRLKDVFGFRGPVSDILLFNQFINMTKKEFKIKQRYTPDIAQGVIRQTHRDKETGKQFTDRTIEYSSGVIRSEWEAEEIQLSRMELLYYYILSKNEQSYQILTDMGTDTQAPKGQFDKNDFDELLENLTPQEKMMGDVLQLAAERYYPELNKYHIEKYHTELGKSKNYFPRKTELTEVKPLELFNDYVQYSGVISAQKQRTAGLGSRIAPANALAVLFNHIEKANTLIIMGKQLDLMNSVFKEQNLKKKIEAVWGIETTKEFYNHIAGNLYSGQASILSEAESLIGTIENNVIKAQIFAKAQVGLKQIISFMNYGTGDEYVSTSEWSKAFAKQTFSPKEWKKNIDYMLSIPYLKDRFGRGGSTDALKRQLEQRMFAKISLLDDFLSVNIRVGDMVAIVMGGKPYIDVLMEKGYTEEQAQKLFIEKTVNEMQSSIPSTLSNIQRNAAKQPLAKMLFAYQNTPWQYFRVAANSIIQFKQNPSKYTGLNMVKLVGLYMYVFPLIFNLASSLSIVTGDEDELYMDIWKSLIGGITFVPLAGMFVNSILSGFLGERSSTGNWFDTAAAKTGNVARKIAKGDDLTFVDLLKAVALFGEASTGIPLITLGTEVSGAKDIVTGEPVKGAMKVAGYSDYRAKKVSGEK